MPLLAMYCPYVMPDALIFRIFSALALLSAVSFGL